MKTLTIEVEPDRVGEKSRRFSAVLLAYYCADLVWDGGATTTSALRPVYLSLAGPETSLRPVVANLRAGRKATTGHPVNRHSTDKRVELLRSAGYEWSWQRLPNGVSVATAHLPELFAADPGMVDPQVCRFVSAPPKWWADRVLEQLRADGDELALAKRHAARLKLTTSDAEAEALVPRAVHFALYLDRRTRRPLVNSVAFSVQLLCAAMRAKLARDLGDRAWDAAYGLDECGLCPPVMMRATHSELDALLAEQVRLYRETTRGQA